MMVKKLSALICSALLVSSPAALASEDVFAGDGHSFSARVIATADMTWHAKWNTSRSTIPAFASAKSVAKGETLHIVTLFTGAQTGTFNRARVACDFLIQKPDGKTAMAQKNTPCYTGEVAAANLVYRVAPIIKFVGDPGDPVGVWRVSVTVRDAISGKSVTTRTSFELK